ncbi:MAG: hypothetical protein IJB59_09540 [Oscillospiraceae bacterium]|nr:hypothetical protein [Oscillospiraceae bacterium]
MKKELREKILAFNKSVREKGEKATDLDILVAEVKKLPYGQLKKVLTPEVLAVLEKYGYTE